MSAPSLRPRLPTYGFAALLLTVAADALFFDAFGRSFGLSVPVFVLSVGMAAVVCRPRSVDRALLVPSFLLVVALAALVETVDATSLPVAAACLGAFVLALSRRLPRGLEALPALGLFLFRAPLALLQDIRSRRAILAKRTFGRHRSRPAARVWLVWAMPTVLACGFVFLLAAGNPILERWVAKLDPFRLLWAIDPARVLFWVLVIVLVWPFLRPRLFQRRVVTNWRRRETVPAAPSVPTNATSLIFGPAAIFRALGLFNAVFALQTLLDAVYLWGGVELPAGIGYAAYAHRGAYTLVATALLAAGFVLFALRNGTKAAADRRIRALVYLWIGQNVVLVLSAMLRLDLYVEIYALTHWRLAAFVWMGIVAAGLVLICVRIAGERSNRWLIGANVLMLGLVGAGACFADDDALIARFNVAHSSEMSGRGVPLDLHHLASLGPAAIPSIDRYLAHAIVTVPGPYQTNSALRVRLLRSRLAMDHRSGSIDWRDWTFRRWRLTRYLDSHEAPVAVLPINPAPPSADGPFR